MSDRVQINTDGSFTLDLKGLTREQLQNAYLTFDVQIKKPIDKPNVDIKAVKQALKDIIIIKQKLRQK